MTDHERVVRPTLRCLLYDLSKDIAPSELRLAVNKFVADQAEDRNQLLPLKLTDARHLLLDMANQLAQRPAQMARIVKITDRVVWKVKSSDRRGAMWRDERGTWWLLAAGRRKDDGPGDFYRELGSNSDAIVPTDADARYLLLESAFAEQCDAECHAQRRIIDALIDAASEPGTLFRVSVFGAELSIRICPDEGELAVLEVSWNFVQFEEQGRFPYDVLAMIPGYDGIDGWTYWPPLEGAPSPHSWHTLVPQVWVLDLATSVEIQHLVSGAGRGAPPSPSSNGSEYFSHWAGRTAVTMAYLTGIEIIGICGARVVAHRDYASFPICPACDDILRVLRSTGHA